MPRWLPRLLTRIQELVRRHRVRLTAKAAFELAAFARLDVGDACDVLAALTKKDFVGRVESHDTGEWLYVFKPVVAGTVVYLKLILRRECVLISFHADDGEIDEESAP